jgi:hypothetical protein
MEKTMSISSSQANIVGELFVRTADENYITARWCAMNQLHTDFAWLGVHALEKYLKAVLLYNGRQAKKQGHDILKLYRGVTSIAGKHLPKKLVKPPELVIGHWFERTPEGFLEHLYQNGNADNRYLIYGHDTRTEDLHMLDTLVFAIRRLICTLDDPLFDQAGMRPKTPIPSNRDVLLRQPEYCPHLFMPLDNLIRSKTDDSLRHAALNLNLAFAPADFIHTEMRGGDSGRVPVILRRVLEPMKRDDLAQVQEGLETGRWLLKNVKLPGDGRTSSGVVREVHEAIVKAESRLGLSRRSAWLAHLHRLLRYLGLGK